MQGSTRVSTMQLIGTIGFVVLLSIPLLLVGYTMVRMVVEDHRRGDHELIIITGSAIAFGGLLLLFAAMAKGGLG